MIEKIVYLPVLLMVLLLTACAGAPAVRSESPPQLQTAIEEALPSVELEQDILYDVLLGEIAGKRGRIGVSVDVLARAARKTRDPRLAERAARAALYIKDYEAALAIAELWVELQPEDIEARSALATTLLGLNRPVEAQLHFEKVLAIAAAQDKLEHTFLRIASILGQQGNRGTAFELMESLVRLYPNEPHAHFALAHLAVRADDPVQARAAIDQALALRPDWEDAALFKVRILISRKDNAAAEAFFQDFVRRNPDATRVRLNYARFLVDLKQWEKARKQFKRVVKAAPNDADAVMAVGLLALQVNRLDEAETYLKRNLELQPGNDQARLYLGQVAEQRRQYDEAERWYREISDENYYFEAQMRVAVIIAMRGDVPAARKRLHGIRTRTERERVQAVLTEEQILREVKQYGEAFDVLTRALASMPAQHDLLYARALVAEKLDKLDVVERDLRAVLKRDPKNVNALNALGYTLADRTDRYDEALALLTEALEQKPNDPFVLDSMGWLQYRLGNYDEAIRYLEQALALRDDAEISAHLGEVLWMAGDRTQARTVWRRALKHTPDNESLLSIIKKFGQ